MTDAANESPLVHAAQEALAGRLSVLGLEDVFSRSTVFGQRPESPGVMVTDLGPKGRWAVVFSSAQRLGRFAGKCEFFSTTGADLRTQVPSDIGILLDCQDDHGIALNPSK